MSKSRTLRHVFVCQALLLLMTAHGVAQTLEWRYAGGDADGGTLLAAGPADLMSNAQLARFAGGGGDGHSLLNPDPLDLSNNGQLARFGGGSGDGYALFATNPLDLANNGQLARFGGGNEDGHALGIRTAADFANNAQSAKFAGGDDDGYAALASTPRDLSNGDQLAWMRGGDGDGHAAALTGPRDLGGRTQLARFAGGSEDGYALLASVPADLANRSQLAKMIGGDGDGSALLTAAPMDLAGFPQLAKFAGGDGDGHGSDAYQSNTGNVPAVQVAAFLQGPFGSGVMTTALNTGNWIPLSQPYNTTPWNYIGADSVLSIPSASIVDWVLLELRSGTAANTLAEQRAAFIRSDGRIVAVDGASEVTFPHTGAGYYYLVVKHRNHLAVMSDTTRYFGALNAPVIDFRSSAAAAYGTNAMKTLTGGYFGLFAGDGTANGAITISDRNAAWRPQNGTNGYLRGDFNLSGGVTITDRNTYWRPNNGISTAVP